jgi:cell shape-determining protein MreC
MSEEVTTDGGQSRPDWRVPAARCGLEVTLVLLIAAYLWLHLGSALLRGVVAVAGLVGAVATLMWYVNQLSVAWVRYASDQTKRRQRERRRKRQRRRKQAKRQQE